MNKGRIIMDKDLLEIAQRLLEISKEQYKKSDGTAHLVDDENINRLFNNLEDYPHAFVLGCVMDKQIQAKRAWTIPYKVCEALKGKFDIDTLAEQTEEYYINLFKEGGYHRFNEQYAIEFYNAIQKIKNDYNGDASKIWAGNPSSSLVVYRFLEFDGVGPKIATMAANILVRDFKIPMKDHYSIDISPDTHVKKVMKRLGFINEEDGNLVIYKAREINPKFPGMFDLACFGIGRKYCHRTNPNCEECCMNDLCRKCI